MKRLIFEETDLSSLYKPKSVYKTIGIDSDGVVKSIDNQGVINEIGASDGEIEFDILYSDENEMLQIFDDSTQITDIVKSSTVGTFSYSVNGATFSDITLPLQSDIVINDGDEVNWKVTFNSGQELGSINIKGFKI